MGPDEPLPQHDDTDSVTGGAIPMGRREFLATAAAGVGMLAIGLSAANAAAPAAVGPAAATGRNAEKRWPDEPLRGLCTFAYTPNTTSRFLGEADFQRFRGWDINLIRLGMSVDRGSRWDVKPGTTAPPILLDDPMAPYKQHIEGLRRTLALAEKYHIFVIPVAGDVVGRHNDVMYRESDDGGYYQQLASFWEYVATHFGSHPWLLAYDLLNEPNTKNDVESWNSKVLPQLIRRVRAIDGDTYMAVEPAPWALPDQAFRPGIEPVKDAKSVYSFHFYYPHTYTHQGIRAYKGVEYKGKPYPGMLRLFADSPLLYWDKAALEASMQNAIQFQQKFGVKIWVGEFSAIRWAPGAARWVADAISLFEEHGFSWTFHSYGGWNGWNPTFAADAPESAQAYGGAVTDRLQMLINGWAKNRKL